MYWLIFIALLIVGALASPTTLLHTFAVGLDMFGQMLGTNRAFGITISARSGLAARHGKAIAARIIDAIFFNKNHCEEAINADIARAIDSLDVLFDKNPPPDFLALKATLGMKHE